MMCGTNHFWLIGKTYLIHLYKIFTDWWKIICIKHFDANNAILWWMVKMYHVENFVQSSVLPWVVYGVQHVAFKQQKYLFQDIRYNSSVAF